jgi:hypothetical protein
LNKKDLKNDNMNKYRPRYESIDKKDKINIKFDENKSEVRKKNDDSHACRRLQR